MDLRQASAERGLGHKHMKYILVQGIQKNEDRNEFLILTKPSSLVLFTFTFTFTAIRLTPGTLTKVSAAKIKKTALFALFASSLPRLYINTTIRKLLFFASHFYGRLSSSAAGSITPSTAHSTCAASV